MRVTIFTWLVILFAIILFIALVNRDKDENITELDFLEEEEPQEEELPDGLHPVVAKNKDELIQRAEEKDITVVVTDGFRSIEDQDALYAMGRSESGQIVTNAEGGESFHNYGLAIDFALQTEEGNLIWDTSYDGNDNGKSDWMEVVRIAKDLGFEWGGDWQHFKDYPHLQMRFGLRISELKRGERPEIN